MKKRFPSNISLAPRGHIISKNRSNANSTEVIEPAYQPAKSCFLFEYDMKNLVPRHFVNYITSAACYLFVGLVTSRQSE